ncbi:AfsR/SARP family transcriptional regulator [Streptomyces lichenis]|uniref:AfsR/SARP family transcriptional regulator n=1 Tax=Streptomyces lichenis TaxID=2306967 RepID=A0ABT0IF76_9ACTN|nr:BTAD domain-containing putative transcriptional regulator [Streptomyces lichenis]MCK8679986.1 AfsR/SARP family transcriptional regulator [Streptomyces lichenis]
MQFRILGPPDLLDEERRLRAPLTSPKQRRLLGALLARPNAPVPREELVREVWGGDRTPKHARAALGAHVAGLRSAIAAVEGPGGARARLTAGPDGLLLRVAAAETDSGRFGLAVARAARLRRTDPEDAYTVLRGALPLWRGAVLGGGGGPHGLLCAALADGLRDERHRALGMLFDTALRTGRHREVVPELREAIAAHPLCERFHDQLMLALCRSGRSGEAIGVYTEARRRLTEAHGHTPLLRARLEQISTRAPELSGEAAGEHPVLPAPRPPLDGSARTGRERFAVRERERGAGPAERSVLGFLTDLLSGRELYSGGG